LAILNDKSYALKILNKKKIIELKQTDHIKNEKNILADVNHPFVVNLIESF
jgi:serine/threonine protein kinase